jgi:excisionase family DNA binding protein
MQDLLTYSEASTRLNLKLGTLYALVSQGRVPHVRLGRRLVRFSRGDLDAWLRQHALAPQASEGPWVARRSPCRSTASPLRAKESSRLVSSYTRSTPKAARRAGVAVRRCCSSISAASARANVVVAR